MNLELDDIKILKLSKLSWNPESIMIMNYIVIYIINIYVKK